MPQTNAEVHELNQKVGDLGAKMDTMNASLLEIKLYLSKQDGMNLPRKFDILDEKVTEMKVYQDSNSHIGSQVLENTQDIKTIYRWMLMISGGLIFLQFLLVLAGKFLLDKIFR